MGTKALKLSRKGLYFKAKAIRAKAERMIGKEGKVSARNLTFEFCKSKGQKKLVGALSFSPRFEFA